MNRETAKKIIEGMKEIGRDKPYPPTVILLHPEDLKICKRILPEFFGEEEEKDMKRCSTEAEVWEAQDRHEGKPHGWIQWQGTNVCMDVYCECGHHSHVDDEFVFYVRCPACKRTYFCNGHIELIEITGTIDSDAIAEGDIKTHSG